MPRLDDIRSPEQKIQPRLLRHVFRPSWPLNLRARLSSLRQMPALIKQKRFIISLAVITCLIALSAIWLWRSLSDNSDQTSQADAVDPRTRLIKQTLIQEDTSLSVDFTFNLQLTINGQPQAIPANYGQFPDGKAIFNAASANGDIHVQSPENTKFTLKDFFLYWGGQFNQLCLLNHCSSESGKVTMTVNDQPNDQFENYVIQPNDRIVITYQQ